jgi:mono/diheme cytochrome c family protein
VYRSSTTMVVVAVLVAVLAASAQAPTPGQASATGQTPAPAAGQGRGGAGGGRGGRGAGRGTNVSAAPLPLGPVTGNAAIGKTVFQGYMCYACHGYNGETGRSLLAFTTTNLANEQNFIAFLRARADVAPRTPATGMPNFPENTLSDKLARDLYAYVRTFKSSAPELKDIPTLNAIVAAASRPYKP